MPMRVLIVHSGNATQGGSNTYTFVHEQGEALKHIGVTVDYFAVVGKGLRGYMRAFCRLEKKIRAYQPDVIHAHYGLCGALCVLQRQVPVVTSFHGSDINNPYIRVISKFAMRFSKWSIFVFRSNILTANPRRNYSLLPCGIDLTDEQLTAKNKAREQMHIAQNDKVVLFSAAFDNPVKDSALAQNAVRILNNDNANIQLLQLKGYSRSQVNLLMCAVDCLLLTSKHEGSPQVIKEAMACGCPIVSVDVGDVCERIAGIDGCYIANSRSEQEIAELLRKALAFGTKTTGRQRIIEDGLDNQMIAHKLLNIYQLIWI